MPSMIVMKIILVDRKQIANRIDDQRKTKADRKKDKDFRDDRTEQ